MSYCRFGDGDVYMYPTTIDDKQRIVCCACRLSGGSDVLCALPIDANEHLIRHQKAGHHVPAYALERLALEMRQAPKRASGNPPEGAPAK